MNTRASSSGPNSASLAFHADQMINGRYLLLEQIGSGGFAVVYRAKDEEKGRLVAVKFLMLPQIQEYVERFEREARLHQALEGPGILPFFDFGTYAHSDGEAYPFCVLQYIPGGDTLQDLIYYYRNKHDPNRKIQGTCVPVSVALDLFYQISVGLGHAHTEHVIHRDLKPSNVLLQDDGAGGKIAHVMDFGIAAPIASRASEYEKLTMMHMIMGTPHYMSPQQCVGAYRDDENVRTDARNDIWSFGVMMFETLAGQSPFPDFDQMHETKIIEQLIKRNYKRIHMRDICEGLGEEFDELVALVEQCLEHEIDKRPQNMLQIQTRIHKIRSRLGSQSMRITPLPRHVSAIRKDSPQLAETLVAPSTPPSGAALEVSADHVSIVVSGNARDHGQSSGAMASADTVIEPGPVERRSSNNEPPAPESGAETRHSNAFVLLLVLLLAGAGAYAARNLRLPKFANHAKADPASSVAVAAVSRATPVPEPLPAPTAPKPAAASVPAPFAEPVSSPAAVAATVSPPPPSSPPPAPKHRPPPQNTRSSAGHKEIPGVDYFPGDNGPTY